jgi:flagellar hook assembly protein FlgD
LSEEVTLPLLTQLNQNYPNPLNPTTTISFDVAGTSGVKQSIQLTIYNVRGKQVIRLIDSEYEPGNHRVVWNGRTDKGEQVSSGIYLYTLRSGDKTYTRKMVMLK